MPGVQGLEILDRHFENITWPIKSSMREDFFQLSKCLCEQDVEIFIQLTVFRLSATIWVDTIFCKSKAMVQFPKFLTCLVEMIHDQICMKHTGISIVWQK